MTTCWKKQGLLLQKLPSVESPTIHTCMASFYSPHHSADAAWHPPKDPPILRWASPTLDPLLCEWTRVCTYAIGMADRFKEEQTLGFSLCWVFLESRASLVWDALCLKPPGLYQTLTSSTLNKDSLRDLLCHLYPNEEPNVLSDLCHLLFSEIDRENKGSINEDQVVSWVQGLPQAHVLPVLDFPILPPAITSAQERVLAYTLTSTDLDDHGRIPDKQLHQVALLMAKRRRDWRLLANHLGFLEKDCIFFDKKHFEASEKILDMLQVWRNASGKQAQSKTLQNALKQTNNSDIANEVFNLNF